MATTTPDEIWTPDSGDQYALTTDLAATADTVQDALLRRRIHTEAGSDPSGTSGFQNGDTWLNTSTGVQWILYGGAWVAQSGTFTPDWNGTVTVGASTQSGKWHRLAPDLIRIEVELVLASGWNFNSGVRLNPPFPLGSPTDTYLGGAIFVDSGTAYYPGFIARSSSLVAPLYIDTPTGRLADVTNTTPFAWTVGDKVELTATFRTSV